MVLETVKWTSSAAGKGHAKRTDRHLAELFHCAILAGSSRPVR